MQKARASCDSCALTARAVSNRADLRFVALWDLQPGTGSYQLRKCAFVCSEVALLLDTAAMLSHFSRADADTDELTRLAKLFSAANQREGAPARPRAGSPR